MTKEELLDSAITQLANDRIDYYKRNIVGIQKDIMQSKDNTKALERKLNEWLLKFEKGE